MNKAASLVMGIYVHHLFALSKAVRDGCDAIFKGAPVPPTDGYIKVDPALHAEIDGVLIDAANLKKLIVTPKERGKDESTRTFEFRKLRTDAMAEFLEGLSLDVISDVHVRNSLEHFDERLDKLGGRLADGEPAPKPIAAYNLAFSSWAAVQSLVHKEIYPLRVYVADVRTYFNFDHRLDLGKLREEAAAIVGRIEESGALQGEPGGLMVVFPPDENDIARNAP